MSTEKKEKVTKAGKNPTGAKRGKKAAAAEIIEAKTEVAVSAAGAGEAAPVETAVVAEEGEIVVTDDGNVVIVEEGEVVVETVGTGERAKRVVLSRDEVLNSFESIIQAISAEIEASKLDTKKPKGTKFLRSTLRNLITVKNQASKLMKKPRDRTKASNANSGFLKPVKISKDMAKFTGWSSTDKKSRVEVTKFICNYIKENNLQNPEDRRQIFADPKLKKLLGVDLSNDNPLTYYKIQTFIKPHFIKE